MYEYAIIPSNRAVVYTYVCALMLHVAVPLNFRESIFGDAPSNSEDRQMARQLNPKLKIEKVYD